MRVTPEHLDQIKGYEAAATPGPWTSNGHELYYGLPGPRTTHQQIPREADARLIAVARSWLPDLIADLEEARAERDRLRGLMQSLADRVAAQSALLSRRAEKEASQ